MLALLPLLLAAQPELPREASSLEHIGEVIATARVCGAFGYIIDRQGLADWAAASRDRLAARDPSLTPDMAQLDIERFVIGNFARDYYGYWQQGTRDGRRADAFIDAEHRFVNLQRKGCDRLARSGEVGRFLTPPGQEPPASEVIRHVRDEFSRVKHDR